MDNKINNYLAKEIEGQFSQEKMDEIYTKKFGHSRLSPGLQKEWIEIKKLADLKSKSVMGCAVCQKPCVVNDIHQQYVLCHEHMGASSVVESLLNKRKQGFLTAQDFEYLQKTRTVRSGNGSGFFDPKHPNKFVEMKQRQDTEKRKALGI